MLTKAVPPVLDMARQVLRRQDAHALVEIFARRPVRRVEPTL